MVPVPLGVDGEPTLSPDGRWRWDGWRWVPVWAVAAPSAGRALLHRVPPAAVVRPAGIGLLTSIGACALAIDVCVHSGGLGVGAEAVIIALSATLLISGRALTLSAKALAVAAPILGAGVALRDSPWVAVPDLVGAACALALAASLCQMGSFTDLPPRQALSRALQWLTQFPQAHCFAGDGLRRHLGPRSAWSGNELRSVARGVAIAAPLVIVVAVLLASGDAVFASTIRFDVDLASLSGHLVVVAVATACLTTLMRVASSEKGAEVELPSWRLGRLEALVVVGGLDAVYLVFNVVQLVGALGGADHILQAQGLTYSDYARSGFFQLLGASAVTLVTLLAIRALAAPGGGRLGRYVIVLMELAVVLTVVAVGIAVRRLQLYDDVYGLTMRASSPWPWHWPSASSSSSWAWPSRESGGAATGFPVPRP